MTVKELIALLKQYNEHDIVVLSTDEEGNDFAPLRDVSEGFYTPERDVLLRELTPELEQEGYTSEDVGDPNEGGSNCITLWP